MLPELPAVVAVKDDGGVVGQPELVEAAQQAAHFEVEERHRGVVSVVVVIVSATFERVHSAVNLINTTIITI